MCACVCTECRDELQSSSELYQALSELPQPNRDTLAYLIIHLHRSCSTSLNSTHVPSLSLSVNYHSQTVTLAYLIIYLHRSCSTSLYSTHVPSLSLSVNYHSQTVTHLHTSSFTYTGLVQRHCTAHMSRHCHCHMLWLANRHSSFQHLHQRNQKCSGFL